MKKTLKRQANWLWILLGCVVLCTAGWAAWRSEPARLPETPATPTSPTEHLDDPTDSLYWDNGEALYYFSYPDLDDDSFFNVRFQAPDTCKLLGAWFMLYENGSYGTPDFVPLIWSMGADSFPDEILGGDTIAWDEIDTLAWSDEQYFYPAWAFFDFSDLDIYFSADQWFLFGFTGVLHEPSDTIAIISDNGVPSTPYSGFMWRAEWYSMEDIYGIGYNLFVRTIVDLGVAGVRVLEPGGMPSTFHLESPYPNPFNPTATLRFSIVEAAPVKLTIRDILGRTVATLAEGRMTPGVYSVTVDGTDWPSGIYFANLMQGHTHQTVRLVLTK